jgi:hypothetical protein
MLRLFFNKINVILGIFSLKEFLIQHLSIWSILNVKIRPIISFIRNMCAHVILKWFANSLVIDNKSFC